MLTAERKNEIMAVIVKDLTKEDVANVVAYYNGIKFKVEAPAP